MQPEWKNIFRGDVDMPNWVKGSYDEKLWRKAKTIVTDQYGLTKEDGEQFWRLVTGVYKQAGGQISKTNENRKTVMDSIMDTLTVARQKMKDEMGFKKEE